jgi:O-antigen ligase
MLKEEISKVIPRLINFILILLIIFSPLLYGSVTVLGYTLMISFIFLLGLLWFLEMLLSNKLSFLKTKLLIPFILFILLIIFQIIPLPFKILEFISPKTAYFYKEFLPLKINSFSFFTLSISVDLTITALFKLLSYFLIFILIINYIETKRQFELLFNTIIISAVFISTFAIIQRFTYGSLGKVFWFDKDGSSPSCFGPFVNRNHFAGYIEMAIPLSLGYFISEIETKRKVFYGLGVFIMSLALFLSLSRAGMAVYLIDLLLALFLWLKRGFREQTNIVWLVSLFIIILLFFLTDFRVIFNRFISIFEGSLAPIFERGYRWQDILRIWQDFPFFGTGLETFQVVASFYKSSNLQMVIVHAHNDYLQLLSETGIFGFLSIFLFFYLYFSHILRILSQRHDRFVIILVLAGLVSLIGILIHSSVDFNLHIPANALLFFIIMGLSYKLAFTKFKKRHGLSSEGLAEDNRTP